ncbi:hypothetical protein CR513_38495, partial [Mucuna pruriens]
MDLHWYLSTLEEVVIRAFFNVFNSGFSALRFNRCLGLEGNSLKRNAISDQRHTTPSTWKVTNIANKAPLRSINSGVAGFPFIENINLSAKLAAFVS